MFKINSEIKAVDLERFTFCWVICQSVALGLVVPAPSIAPLLHEVIYGCYSCVMHPLCLKD